MISNSSTVPVLRFLSDVLVDGALLIFDDWYCFRASPEQGEQNAPAGSGSKSVPTSGSGIPDVSLAECRLWSTA